MVRMRYAYNPNGEIVHVDQVCRGRRDGCTCIECHEPVEAHQGQIRAHYYSHCKNTACPGPSKDKIRKLTTVSESQIHAYAKKIISRNSIIAAPVVSCDLSPLLEHPLPLYPPKKIDYRNAAEEYNAGNYRSDVRISTDRAKIDVEICVEHPVDDAKLQKVRRADAHMIEITLTDIAKNIKGKDSGIKYKDLRELVLYDSSRRRWINHPDCNRIRKKVLNETLVPGGTLYTDTNKYCPCNYDRYGNRKSRYQSCSTCKFHHIDRVSGKEYCSTYSPWVNVLPAYSLSVILSEKTCPYCGATILLRYCRKAENGSFICCSDPWGKCRFRLDFAKTKAKLAAAHLCMPDYLAKA